MIYVFLAVLLVIALAYGLRPSKAGPSPLSRSSWFPAKGLPSKFDKVSPR